MAPSYPKSYHDLEVTFTAKGSSASSKANVHYVEAGDPSKHTILLLHGFPSSSFQFREFIPLLSANYHVLAPDYPGFGLSQVSDDDYKYTFDNLNIVLTAWLKALKVEEAAIYIQDFGGPAGFRLAATGGLKVSAVLSQNGNAYDEGLGELFTALRGWWSTKSDEGTKMISDVLLTPDGAKEHIVMGTPEKDMHLIDPQSWITAYQQNLEGPVKAERQLQYLFDYGTNLDLYPEWQKYIRESKVPILATWGKNDPSFIAPGAKAFLKDQPETVVHYVDAGHFATETAGEEIATEIKKFLAKLGL